MKLQLTIKKFLLILTLIIGCFSMSIKAQERFNPGDTDKNVPSSSRPDLKRTTRFSTMEQNQRFGIQQVGEVMADAVTHKPIVKRTVSQPESLVIEANQLSKNGKYDRAAQLYEKAIKLQPNFSNAHEGLGYALIQLGNYDAAIAQYEKALSLSPNDGDVLMNLGVALYSKGRIDDAIKQYQQALDQSKNNFPAAHFNLAMAHAHNSSLDKAIEHYQIAIKQRENNYPEAHNNLGLVYEASGDQVAAGKHFMIAIEQRKGNYPLAHYNLARYHQTQSDEAKAIAALLLAIKQQTNFAEAYLNLGNIHLFNASKKLLVNQSSTDSLKTLLTEAINAYKKAIDARNGFYPLAHEELAIALTLDNQRAAALTQYRIAFQQYNGECPTALQNLLEAVKGNERFSISSELNQPGNKGNITTKQTNNNAHSQRLKLLIEELSKFEEMPDDQKDQADLLYCVGIAYTAIGEWKTACDQFTRAVELSKGADKEATEAITNIISLVQYY